MSELELMREIAFIWAAKDGGYRWWGDVPLSQKRRLLGIVKRHKQRYPHLWKDLILQARWMRRKKAKT